MITDQLLLPQPERSPEYLAERERENAITVRFASVVAFVVDVALGAYEAACGGFVVFDRRAAVLALVFIGVVAMSVAYFLLTSFQLRRNRAGSHFAYVLFYVLVMVAGSATNAINLEGFNSLAPFAATVIGTAVLCRAHWTTLLALFTLDAIVMSGISIASLGYSLSVPQVLYCFVYTAVGFIIAVKMERDNLRLFRNRQELAEKNAQLADLSFRDPLTRLFNRRYLIEALLHEMIVARRNRKPLSVGLIDFDFFKNVNDQLGHQIGDSALKELSLVIAGTLRESDICARYGGEEFVVIFAGSSLASAALVAERLRAAVESYEVRGVPWHVTLSIGVTELRPDESEEQLLRRADDLLYQAKEAGRNRVVTG